VELSVPRPRRRIREPEPPALDPVIEENEEEDEEDGNFIPKLFPRIEMTNSNKSKVTINRTVIVFPPNLCAKSFVSLGCETNFVLVKGSFIEALKVV